MIKYEGIDEATLIHALYHGTVPLGMGMLHNRPRLTVEEVREALGDRLKADTIYIDYLFGRPLKVNINTKAKEFDPRLFDRDAGQGMAETIVMDLLTRPAIGRPRGVVDAHASPTGYSAAIACSTRCRSTGDRSS